MRLQFDCLRIVVGTGQQVLKGEATLSLQCIHHYKVSNQSTDERLGTYVGMT